MPWFGRDEPQTPVNVPNVRLVEVEKLRELSSMTPELAQQIQSLQHHPGFTYLAAKLRLQRSLMINSLLSQRQEKMVDVEFLKSGIAWTAWLDNQLAQAVGYKERTSAPLAALDEELEAFKQAQAQLELVGR